MRRSPRSTACRTRCRNCCCSAGPASVRLPAPRSTSRRSPVRPWIAGARSAADRGIALERAIDGEAGLRWAARADVERALDALVENALRYSPAGTAVTIATGPRGIEVRDRGSGLEPGELELVFERFHRGRSGRAGPPGQRPGALDRPRADARVGWRGRAREPRGRRRDRATRDSAGGTALSGCERRAGCAPGRIGRRRARPPLCRGLTFRGLACSAHDQEQRDLGRGGAARDRRHRGDRVVREPARAASRSASPRRRCRSPAGSRRPRGPATATPRDARAPGRAQPTEPRAVQPRDLGRRRHGTGPGRDRQQLRDPACAEAPAARSAPALERFARSGHRPRRRQLAQLSWILVRRSGSGRASRLTRTAERPPRRRLWRPQWRWWRRFWRRRLR